MRIGKIAKSAEYRMDEQFQNLLIFGDKFWFFKLIFFSNFPNFTMSKIVKFPLLTIHKIIGFLKLFYFKNWKNLKI